MRFKDFLNNEGLLEKFKKSPKPPQNWGGPKKLAYGGSPASSFGSKSRSMRTKRKNKEMSNPETAKRAEEEAWQRMSKSSQS